MCKETHAANPNTHIWYIFCQYNSCGYCRWLKLIDYLFYWTLMRSLEEKVAFCLYSKTQKGPSTYYSLKSLQRDEPVKKLTFNIKNWTLRD